MKARHISQILVFVLFLSILMVSSATVIQTHCYCGGNCQCDTPGYEWSGSTVLITLPGEYLLASDIPSNTVIFIQTSGVTIEGDTIIESILGQQDLNIRNFKSPGTKVDVCNDIADSSVAEIETVHGNVTDSSVAGIGTVYGNVIDSSVAGIGIARGNVTNSSVAGIGIVRGNVIDSSVAGIGIASGDIVDSSVTGIGIVRGNIAGSSIVLLKTDSNHSLNDSAFGDIIDWIMSIFAA